MAWQNFDMHMNVTMHECDRLEQLKQLLCYFRITTVYCPACHFVLVARA